MNWCCFFYTRLLDEKNGVRVKCQSRQLKFHDLIKGENMGSESSARVDSVSFIELIKNRKQQSLGV